MPEWNDSFPPVIFTIMQTGNRANGGVESITLVIERLKGFRPIVVTQLETPVVERWRRAGAEVHVWSLPYQMGSRFCWSPFLQKWQRLVVLLEINIKMARLVRSTKSLVVHCNDMFGFLHTALGARLGGARVVRNVRGTKPDGKYRLHWHWAYRLSDATVVLSREMARLHADGLSLGEDGARIFSIYSAIDFSVLEPLEKVERSKLRRHLGVPSREVAFGYVGVVSPGKGQLPFIEYALPELTQRCPECHVYFLGDFDPEYNTYACKCLAAVRSLGLDDFVTFVGYVDNIYEWYRAFDLTVIASEREGLARAMIESLACGTPVVSFDVCSAREILKQHECGRVVMQGDYAGLAQQLADLVDKPLVCDVLGANGSQTARKLFDPVRIVRQYERLYSDLAKEKGH